MSEVKNRKKPALIITIVVLVVAAIIIASYFIFTRDFMMLFLNDEKYVQYTVAQNLKSTVSDAEDEEQAYSISGTAGISTPILKSGDAADYLNGFSFKSVIYSKGLSAKTSTEISDKSGKVLTINSLMSNQDAYISIDELKTGWLKMSNSLISETEDTSTDNTESYDVDKVMEIAEDSKNTKNIQKQLVADCADILNLINESDLKVIKKTEIKSNGISASGTVCTMTLTGDQIQKAALSSLKAARADKDLYNSYMALLKEIKSEYKDFTYDEKYSYSDYQATIDELTDYVKTNINSKSIEKVNIEICMNRTNDIVGLTISEVTEDGTVKAAVATAGGSTGIELKSGEASLVILIKDSKDAKTIESSVSYGKYVSATLSAKITEIEYKDFKMPSKAAGDLSDEKTLETVETNLISYLTETLPKSDTSYAEFLNDFKAQIQSIVYNYIVSSLMGTEVSADNEEYFNLISDYAGLIS